MLLAIDGSRSNIFYGGSGKIVHKWKAYHTLDMYIPCGCSWFRVCWETLNMVAMGTETLRSQRSTNTTVDRVMTSCLKIQQMNIVIIT